MTATHILVPVEPTEAMIEAGAKFYANNPGLRSLRMADGIFRAMLAAAPPPPEDVAERAVAAATSVYSPDNPTLYGAALNGAHAALEMAVPSPREKALEEALRPFAGMRTMDEIMHGPEDMEWRIAPPERRIEIMGERKRKRDADILAARALLDGKDGR